MSDAPDSLPAALAQLQTRLPRIPKDERATVTSQRTGKTHSYTYANLATVSQKILPLMGELGLSFLAKPTYGPGGEFALTYSLQHVSGGREDGVYPLPSPAEASPQQIGSAITYARRYCLCAVTGVSPDDDDDDAAAAERDDGLPVNRDGSLSRSRTTDEQKDAAGVMTSAQLAEHTSLQPKAAEVRDGLARADDCGDVWTSDTLPPPSEIDQDTPGTITRSQQNAMHAAFAAIGITERPVRLAWTRTALRLPALVSSSSLSYRQAGTLLEKLDKRQREGTRA